MTFTQFAKEVLGYDTITTFWDDFSIAAHFGLAAVKDTFDRAFAEWKTDYKYLTELVLVLNHKIWQHYKENPKLAELYNELWNKAGEYACKHLKDEEFEYFYTVTD